MWTRRCWGVVNVWTASVGLSKLCNDDLLGATILAECQTNVVIDHKFMFAPRLGQSGVWQGKREKFGQVQTIELLRS